MRVYVLSTIQGGTDIYNLIRKSIPVAGIIGLSPENKEISSISGYFNSRKLERAANTEYCELSSYNLSSPADKQLLLSLEIDVLIVAGWQRLIPQWLIDHVKVCCVGIHGSPLGITKGRGRSPQNWALILGLTDFYLSIFKITSGIDDGEIILTQKFVYNSRDNIRTSYIKVSWVAASLIMKAYHENLFEKKGEKQKHEDAEYFPKRSEEDGEIDWNQSTERVVNFVRALTKPYGGAFSFVNGTHKLSLWDAVALEVEDDSFLLNHANGELVSIFCDGELLIKCQNGFVIVPDYTCDIDLKKVIGETLPSLPFREQLKRIQEKHEKKYPDLKISSELLKEFN